MFSMCSEHTPRARIPDTRIPQLMQPCFQPKQKVDLCSSGWSTCPSLATLQAEQLGLHCR